MHSHIAAVTVNDNTWVRFPLQSRSIGFPDTLPAEVAIRLSGVSQASAATVALRGQIGIAQKWADPRAAGGCT
jgi:hypothetical protein